MQQKDHNFIAKNGRSTCQLRIFPIDRKLSFYSGTLRSDDSDGDENIKKGVGLRLHPYVSELQYFWKRSFFLRFQNYPDTSGLDLRPGPNVELFTRRAKLSGLVMKSPTTRLVQMSSSEWVSIVQHVLSVCFRRTERLKIFSGTRFSCLRTCNSSLQHTVELSLRDTGIITRQNVTLSNE